MADVDPDSVVSHAVTQPQVEGVESLAEPYWTAERKAAARPLPGRPPGVADEAGVAPSSFEETAPSAAGLSPRHRAPAVPAGLPVVSIGLSDPAPSPFRTTRVPARTSFPYSAIGKLFMTLGGVDSAGTAWVVGDRVLVTAGHCLHDGADWARNLVFSPFYPSQPEPDWAARALHVLAGWIAGGGGAGRYDLGAVVLDRPVAPRTGALGWRAAYPPDQAPRQASGFPILWDSPAYPFDGRQLWRTDGRYAGAGNPLSLASNMTQGCSGGPWLIEQGGQAYAVGLNSYQPGGEATIQSPRFGRGFLNLLAAAGA
ncbi:MAG: hypothetical protein JOZ90_13165 [Alphaproteobacteria bacterium]|nr:hypothetical protein [Alphaproteobacteria bacterium]MBV9370320.1 hypothetical protein [Alphaproteobacteria bacterium]MBV9902023.1 hypothetical protein [Alphaproteobacteria bacterium]